MKKLFVLMICCFAMVGLQAQDAKTADAKKSCAKTCTGAQKAACSKKMANNAGVSLTSLESEGYSDVSACQKSGKISGHKVCSTSGKVTTKTFNPETNEVSVVTTSQEGELINEEITIIEASSVDAAIIDDPSVVPASAKSSTKSCSKSCSKKCASKKSKKLKKAAATH